MTKHTSQTSHTSQKPTTHQFMINSVIKPPALTALVIACLMHSTLSMAELAPQAQTSTPAIKVNIKPNVKHNIKPNIKNAAGKLNHQTIKHTNQVAVPVAKSAGLNEIPPANINQLQALEGMPSPPNAEKNAGTITLEQILQSAPEHDSEFLAKRYQQRANQEKVAQAQAAFLPTLRWDTTAQLAYVNPNSGESYHNNSLNTGLNLNQSIYRIDRQLNVQQAQQASILAETTIALEQQNLWLNASEIYITLLKQTAELQTLGKKQNSIEEQLRFAQRNFDVGLTTITDVREAQARLDAVLAQKIGIANQINIQKNRLEQMIDRPIPAIQTITLDIKKVNALLNEVNARPAQSTKIRSIYMAELAKNIADKEYEKVQKSDYPTLDAYAGINYTHTQNNNPNGNIGSGNKNASIGLQLSVPLLTGRAKSSKLVEMSILRTKAQQDWVSSNRKWQENQFAITQTLAGLIAQNAAINSALNSATLNLSATEMAYKVGVRINVDVLNAQDQVYETQKQLTYNAYDILFNALRLQHNLDTLTPNSWLTFTEQKLF